jgi:hypothetical protein
VVASGEAEVGVALVEALTAGETTEQGATDKRRETIRDKLYAGPGAG